MDDDRILRLMARYIHIQHSKQGACGVFSPLGGGIPQNTLTGMCRPMGL